MYHNNYRFQLEKGSAKHICPNPDCNKKKYKRYVDMETGNLLPYQYGRCNREAKCQYELNPYKNGYAKKIYQADQNIQSIGSIRPTKRRKPQKAKLSFMPYEILKHTLEGHKYAQNQFIQNLLKNVPFPFEKPDIQKVIELYYLGTISDGYMKGAITLPFIDIKGNIRTIQVKKFDRVNHTTKTNFLHSMVEYHYKGSNTPLPNWLKDYKKNEKYVSCLFGEHLLSRYPNNPVALVEAPKTAIYSTLYLGFPENQNNLLWLGVFNLGSLTYEKCKALKGRIVYLFPDLANDGAAYKKWYQAVEKFKSELPDTIFIFSDLLEKNASSKDRLNGLDLADYLIQQNWKEYR